MVEFMGYTEMILHLREKYGLTRNDARRALRDTRNSVDNDAVFPKTICYDYENSTYGIMDYDFAAEIYKALKRNQGAPVNYDKEIQAAYDAYDELYFNKDEDEDEDEVDAPYTLKGGVYTFTKEGLALNEASVSSLFVEYSKHGRNRDFPASAHAAGMSVADARVAKKHLDLTKQSLPFTPERMHSVSVEDAVDDVNAGKSQRIHEALQRRTMRDIQRKIDKYEGKECWITARFKQMAHLGAIPTVTRADMQPIPASRKLTAFWSMHDEHWGKQSYDNSYDILTQYTEMIDASRRVVECIKNRGVSDIVTMFGSDMFNVDTVNMTTTKGTSQENMADIGTMADHAIAYFVQSVNEASKHARVHIYIVAGNHDKSLASFSGVMLRHIFQHNDRVSIVDGETTRKYHACGSTLVCMMHGDIQVKDIANIAYPEAYKQMGNSTPFQRLVVMQGHYHGFSLDMKEDGMMTRTTATSASPSCKWTVDRFGIVRDRNVTIYFIEDDHSIVGIDFVKVGA